MATSVCAVCLLQVCNVSDLFYTDAQRTLSRQNGHFIWRQSRLASDKVAILPRTKICIEGYLKFGTLLKTKNSLIWNQLIRGLPKGDVNSFCGICRRQCHFKFNMVFWKPCMLFCAKQKEVGPIKLISLRQISVSIAIKYIINNSVWKYRIRSSIDDCHTFFCHWKYL